MEVSFVIVAPSKSRKSYTVRLPVVVGRGDDVKFRIQRDSVSRRHCEFTHDGGVVHVTDLGSTNGTLVGGKRIAAGAATAVPSGVEVQIGATVLRVEYVAPAVAAAASPRDDDTVPLAEALAAASGSASDLPELEVVGEPLPELEPVDAPAPESAGRPAAGGAGAAAAKAPVFPDVEPVAGADDLAALPAAEPAAPVDGSFDFLAAASDPPPAADDKLDDFFKSLS